MFFLEQLESHPDGCLDLAETLRPVTYGMRQEPDGTHRLWYQGRERYFDVFFLLKDQRLSWAQFSLRGLVLSFDVSKRFLSVDQTDEMEQTAYAVSATRTLKPLAPALATRFTRIAMAIVAARAEDPYFAAFGRQLRASLADQYTTIELR
jgi:hypothetical protein